MNESQIFWIKEPAEKKNVCLLSLLFETLEKMSKSVKTEGSSVASKPGVGGERREKL